MRWIQAASRITAAGHIVCKPSEVKFVLKLYRILVNPQGVARRGQGKPEEARRGRERPGEASRGQESQERPRKGQERPREAQERPGGGQEG